MWRVVASSQANGGIAADMVADVVAVAGEQKCGSSRAASHGHSGGPKLYRTDGDGGCGLVVAAAVVVTEGELRCSSVPCAKQVVVLIC